MADQNTYEAEDCAVGVIDALGFKGIWRRHDPKKVIETLLAGRATAKSNDELSGSLLSGGHIMTRTRFFSDTIVITSVAAGADRTHSSPAELVHAVAFQASSMSVGAACGDPPLAYRGCISYGRLTVRDDFFVGEAIDEAAEWHEQSDAALVWLAPPAAKLFDEEREQREDTRLLIYDVPLRTGRRFRTLAVNPLIWGGADDGRDSVMDHTIDELRQRMLRPFEGNRTVDVDIKRRHTEDFLGAAHHQAWTWWSNRPRSEPFDPAKVAREMFAKGKG